MFDFFGLTIALISCAIIVVVISKMSERSLRDEKYHYRCSNNFRHVFNTYEIEQSYDVSQKIICPIINCCGELKLYKMLPPEDVVRDD